MIHRMVSCSQRTRFRDTAAKYYDLLKVLNYPTHENTHRQVHLLNEAFRISMEAGWLLIFKS